MNPVLTTSHADQAFFRDRTAMLMYPVIVLPFLVVLFFMFGGGKGERYITQDAASAKAGASGFNANVPTAKNGSIDGRDVETPGYGKAIMGQTLSSFTNTRKDSLVKGIQVIPITDASGMASATHASSLAASPGNSSVTTAPVNYNQSVSQPTRASRKGRRSGSQPAGYYYNAPGATNYVSASDQQLASQLRTYESTRQPVASVAPTSANGPVSNAISSNGMGEGSKPANVQLSDNLTATRLSEPTSAADVFNTAPTGGSRPEPTRAVLGGGSYGQKKTIAWMIPVVVHEDQTIKDGQQVKLRLLKEITADGVTIPVNTVLYAMCQLSNDRLRLTVQNLQLHGQLIPLDLDVYDTDGSPGVNVPGLGQSSQINGNLRTSAVQGAQLPGLGGLANTMLSSARMGATQSMRQTTIRLRSGYNLFLKAQ